MADFTSRLPPELIHGILDLATLGKIIRVSLVCQRFRSIAFDHPTYWRYICVDFASVTCSDGTLISAVPVIRAIAQLARSTNALVEVRTLWPDHLTARSSLHAAVVQLIHRLSRAILSNMHRIRRLDIELLVHHLPSILRMPNNTLDAPTLEHLVLFGSRPGAFAHIPPPLGLTAPNLHTLTIQPAGFRLAENVVLPRVVNLTLLRVRYTEMRGRGDWRTICPNVRNLTIRTLSKELHDLPQTWHPWRLRSLSITVDVLETALSRSPTLLDVHELRVDFPDDILSDHSAYVGALVSHVHRRNSNVSLHFDVHSTTLSLVDSSIPQSTSHTLHGMPNIGQGVGLSAMASYITAVDMCLYNWTNFTHVFSSLPCLSRLALVLPFGDNGELSLRRALPHLHGILHCPRMRALQVRIIGVDKTVQASSILHIVSHHLTGLLMGSVSLDLQNVVLEGDTAALFRSSVFIDPFPQGAITVSTP
ncbi:hypothetical protein EXIGLDRAFT_735719 [Exidia glandulosa HHB12029]|uniref:F-box domain-containing protein n=1 Tax=Exidia glandulosa HHB12029 TaxID=1314781 RepID=A0A165PIY0_EXIGL|nr:hypothetical protein EXIGLDRAFT_735719 [Exidia glandulosa HHB12029]